MRSEASLQDDKQIELEAAQWVVSRMDDAAFDQSGFDAWIAADARREPVYDRMWRRIMGPNLGDALDAVGRQRKSRRQAAIGVAACALALLGGYQAWPSVELMLAPAQAYQAPEGALRTVRLDDGSELTLAGGAEVEVRYTRHARAVRLARGTIFADVSRDAQRPFRVEAGDGRVTVLGTRFEVDLKPAMVRVSVERGAVRFGGDGWFDAPLDLGIDEGASLTQGGLARHPADAARHGTARWRAEWVEYKDAPLDEVIADLESVSALPIVIADRGLAKRQVNGRIRLTDPMRQIENLSLIYAFRMRREKDAIILSD